VEAVNFKLNIEVTWRTKGKIKVLSKQSYGYHRKPERVNNYNLFQGRLKVILGSIIYNYARIMLWV
jgi:hypothetical protein